VGREIRGDARRGKEDRGAAARAAVLANRNIPHSGAGTGRGRTDIFGRRGLRKGLAVYARRQGRSRTRRVSRYRDWPCAAHYGAGISLAHQSRDGFAGRQDTGAFASRLRDFLRVEGPAWTKDAAWRELRRRGPVDDRPRPGN